MLDGSLVVGCALAVWYVSNKAASLGFVLAENRVRRSPVRRDEQDSLLLLRLLGNMSPVSHASTIPNVVLEDFVSRRRSYFTLPRCAVTRQHVML
jgi:hypothetical protein